MLVSLKDRGVVFGLIHRCRYVQTWQSNNILTLQPSTTPPLYGEVGIMGMKSHVPAVTSHPLPQRR